MGLLYLYTNVYGNFVRQQELVNERSWYKNNGASIWWDGTDDWWIGLTTEKGRGRGYAYLRNDGSCLSEISNPEWKLYNGSWNVDRSQEVKIQCGGKV